uniref:Uncharacterized protein n=1 Tax=Oryza punctata TaxID=4537 RepID=A0A1V1H919_ORYPU|nr:hypothetical protein [Oryza punctata]
MRKSNFRMRALKPTACKNKKIVKKNKNKKTQSNPSRRPTSPNPPFLLAVVAGAGSARGWAARAGSTRVGAAPGHLLGGDGPSAPATAPVGHHSCRHHPPPRLLAEEDGDQQIGVVEGRRWQIGAGEGGR